MPAKRMILMMLLAVLMLSLAAPFTVFADGSEVRTVRVGWHEPPHFITDGSGRRSGYSYEYQRKIAAYTNWKYQYVKGTWSDLMQKLRDGEIDLMSDVSYTEERAGDMLFSSFPMGTETYYIFVSPEETGITAENISALNGKRVGMTQGSVQKDFFIEWAQKRGIETEIVEMNSDDEEALGLLGKEYDAYVSMDIYGSPETAVPVCKIASSDFYFAVNKERPDLLAELDGALSLIQDENKYYSQQLHEKYLRSTGTNRYLGSAEKEWLSKHGTIRVGYQDNYLAFCAEDKETGELTGALKDYLDYVSTAFENASPRFEAVPYQTADEALQALRKGSIDCVFPANLTDYDAENMGLLVTPVIMHTEMDAVVRVSEQKEFLLKKDVSVAVNKGNTNYSVFLADNYPRWKKAYFDDTAACLEAVADGRADCLVISSYRYSNISKQCEDLRLATVYTGIDMDFCFAVREGGSELYTILARAANIVPESAIHTALTYYSTEDVKTSFVDLIKENLFIITAAGASVLLVIVILLLRSIRAERKIIEEEHLVRDLNKKAFVDALTSVRNKGAYSEYIQKLQDKADRGEQLGLAIGIFDCNDLKLVNDRFGHDKGDIYLKTACQLICSVFGHSRVFRIGGDEFAVILMNSDLRNREELIREFEERRREICSAAANKWEEVHIALGIAVYDPRLDSSVSEAARRADKIMYEDKRLKKAKERAC